MASDLLTRICAELERRMSELRPLVREYERLLEAANAPAPANTRAATVDTPAPLQARNREPAPPRGRSEPRGAQQAILAALEHGSHTVSELVMVTAMSPTEIRGNVSRLAKQRKIARVKRAGDGKSAYALPGARSAGSQRPYERP